MLTESEKLEGREVLVLAGLYSSCDLWGIGEVKQSVEACSPDISSAEESKVLLMEFLQEI